MKKLLTICLLALAGVAHAQGAMQFTSDNHDFGNVPEGTMATYEFKFKNTGNQPVIIANVQASCGCTTPDWTKTPVLPGKMGVIKAMYNSAGRPGVFNKTVTITSNAAEPSKVLSIKGTVLTKEQIKPTLTPAQLAASPHLVLDRSSHDFGKMEAGQQPVARFTVKNTGKTELVLGALSSGCYCVGYKANPAPIAPGQSQVVELLYTQRQLGQVSDAVTITSNDVSGDAKITLRATIVRDLSGNSMVKESGTAVPFK
jgi:archaellum component FlaG (FlaF/FlaG flagellin family)